MNQRGYTLLELLAVVAIIGTVSAMAAAYYLDALERARVTRAIAEIRSIEKELAKFKIDRGSFPTTLAAIRWSHVDPWGSSYQYQLLEGASPGNGGGNGGNGGGGGGPRNEPPVSDSCANGNGPRKDRFLVPINSDFDLYSCGRNRRSVPPLTSSLSADDVVRAADGAFVGLASEF